MSFGSFARRRFGKDSNSADARLHPGQGCADAVVDPMAEGNVRRRLAFDIEAVGRVDERWVPVGHRQGRHDLIADGHPLSADDGVFPNRSGETWVQWREEAEQLLDGAVDAAGMPNSR
jgi:hypothetical protein